MKSLTQYIKESVNWVGSGWEASCTYQLTQNQFYDKLTPENIKNHLKDLVDNYKWHTSKHEWVSKETDLNSESELENWVDDHLLRGKNSNYYNFNLKDVKELIKKIYDEFVNYYSGPHKFIKNKDGEVVSMEDWLKMPCDYKVYYNVKTWEDYFNREWKEIQDNKEKTKRFLINYGKSYLTDAVDITENTIRNIKLDKKIEFGSIAFGSGRQTRQEIGYVKIGEKSKEGKTLFLEYCEDESEAIDLPTVGDLLDLIYKYKEVKLLTPAGVLNTKYANSINVKFYNDFSKGRLGILKFRS